MAIDGGGANSARDISPLPLPPPPPPQLPPRPPSPLASPLAAQRRERSASWSSSGDAACLALRRLRTMSTAASASPCVSSVYATPSVALARPTRPMRCVWSSIRLATSRLTTVLMAWMSSPREATSVATRMGVWPRLNDRSTSCRSACERSPCIASMRWPVCRVRLRARSSVEARVDTKMSSVP